MNEVPKIPVSVIVLTYNEESNIRDCLESLEGWADEVFVVDSYSEDNTVEICREYTDNVVQHAFEDYSAQRNWAQHNLAISNEWIMHLDADERVTPELAEEIKQIFQNKAIEASGFLMPQRSYFLGRWIRYGGMYPVYHLRLYRKEAGRCEARDYDQHFICRGNTARLENDIVEKNEFDLTEWTARHNRWSSAEARQIIEDSENESETVNDRLFGTPIERRRWLKENLYYEAPLFVRPFGYFLYRYFVQKGYKDGLEGLIYHVLQGFWFRFLVDAKIYESQKD